MIINGVRCEECIYRGDIEHCPMCFEQYSLDGSAIVDFTENNGFCYMGKGDADGKAD